MIFQIENHLCKLNLLLSNKFDWKAQKAQPRYTGRMQEKNLSRSRKRCKNIMKVEPIEIYRNFQRKRVLNRKVLSSSNIHSLFSKLLSFFPPYEAREDHIPHCCNLCTSVLILSKHQKGPLLFWALLKPNSRTEEVIPQTN